MKYSTSSEQGLVSHQVFESAPPAPERTAERRRRVLLPAALAWSLSQLIACSSQKPNADSSDASGGDGDAAPGDGDGDGLPGSGTGGGLSIDLGDGDGQEVTDICGDGSLTAGEACDDGNQTDGDGCFSDCRAIEAGFTCPVANQACTPFAKCGDGVLSAPEACDDGGVVSGDGCSDNCKEELGFRCDGVPSACLATVCGDGKQEGAESCEHHPSTLVNGQAMPFNGCTVDFCQKEPDCSGFSCASPCGDGLRINEACDDGNTTSGDGCSATCEQEEGYVCTNAACDIYDPDGDGVGTCLLRVPTVFRDFNLSFVDTFNEGEGGCGSTAGLTKPELVDGRPVYSGSTPNCISSAATFAKWYSDSPPDNSTIVGEILLFDNGAGGFVNRYGTNGDGLTPAQFTSPGSGALLDGNPSFFPIDGHPLALADTRYPSAIPPDIYGGNWGAQSGSHNFHFTTEVLYWFTYTADMDATLSFTGDDDVWVYINNRLAVDIGGIQVPTAGSVHLVDGLVNSVDSRGATSAAAASLGLQDGSVYQVKVFQAERKQVGSSFKLTLAGFDSTRSNCRAKCGDGIIGAGEECDDGVNDGGYNECQAYCILGGYCGDSIVQETEACDDGDPNRPEGCAGCRLLPDEE